MRELQDVPSLVHDRRFREGARRLLAEGKSVGEIARAVRTAAADPKERGGLSFIADRFPRWTRKAMRGTAARERSAAIRGRSGGTAGKGAWPGQRTRTAFARARRSVLAESVSRRQ